MDGGIPNLLEMRRSDGETDRAGNSERLAKMEQPVSTISDKMVAPVKWQIL